MSRESPRVGFIGVGAIAEALITGMCVEGEQRATFLLSPRSAAIANGLAERYPFVTVAMDNQAVIDGSDIVFLAIRPQIAEEVLSPLTFRPEQRIVSLIATYDVARLSPLVAPAKAIMRATPLPPVAQRMGALTLYPPVPEVAALLTGLGQLVQLDNEADMDAFWAVTALMGSYFGLLDEVTSWLSSKVKAKTEAGPFVGAMFNALGSTAQARSLDGFDKLVISHSTPGGLNEQAYRELKAAGWTSLVSQALDLIHARIDGRATHGDELPEKR